MDGNRSTESKGILGPLGGITSCSANDSDYSDAFFRSVVRLSSVTSFVHPA